MDAEILAVGTELLMGQIANTNAQYISKRMQDIGINVYFHSVVGDNPARLKSCLDIALGRADLIIMTGGLGPTQDDLTKETVAKVVGRKLLLHEPSLQDIRQLFEKSGWTMTDNNVKQAYFPEGSMVLKNNHGTAPGCIIEKGEKILVMLPGPPAEMKPMLEESVMPYLEEKSPAKIVSTYLNIFGIGESAVENKLLDLIEGQKDTTIATYVNGGQVTVRLTTKYDKDRTEDLHAPLEQEIRKRLGDRIFSKGTDTLEQVTGKLLVQANRKLAVAETFTGGLIASSLLKIPGVSRHFSQGIITPSQENGSPEEATACARKLLADSSADLALALSGNGQGSAYLVLLAAENLTEPICQEYKLAGDEDRRRNRTVLQALDLIRTYLLPRMPQQP